jgi:carboxymethylenebutenolidase
MTSGTNVRLTAADGHRFDAYEVHPDGASASIVVIQEIFGVNEHIRSVVDRYAAFGYRVIAPALFDRVEAGVELGYDEPGSVAVASSPARSSGVRRCTTPRPRCGTSPPPDRSGSSASASAGRSRGSPGCELPVAAAVGYYGGQIHELNEREPSAPTMLHFGELDHAIPLDHVEAIRAAHPDVSLHVYDGAQHGFACDARGSYDALSATIAFGRTLGFFVSNGVRP